MFVLHKNMSVEWDERKRQENLAKRGLDFADVPALEWPWARVLEDTRKTYPERRYWAFVPKGARLYQVTFCWRGRNVRVISFREASRKERQLYG